jgi:vancomycin permeability regulator SanA
VVFGAALRLDGTPGFSLGRRLEAALRLIQEKPGCLVVVTGGAVSGVAEGLVMRDWLLARGVAATRILVEARAGRTQENADFVVPLLREAGVQSVTLVTERFHLRRALFHLRAALRAGGLAHVRLATCATPDQLAGWRWLTLSTLESAKLLWQAGAAMLRCHKPRGGAR